jgi:hypothetical protein
LRTIRFEQHFIRGSAEADLATAAAINVMVEAATSPEAKPEESTKTSSDDDSLDDDEDGAGVAGNVV